MKISTRITDFLELALHQWQTLYQLRMSIIRLSVIEFLPSYPKTFQKHRAYYWRFRLLLLHISVLGLKRTWMSLTGGRAANAVLFMLKPGKQSGSVSSILKRWSISIRYCFSSAIAKNLPGQLLRKKKEMLMKSIKLDWMKEIAITKKQFKRSCNI